MNKVDFKAADQAEPARVNRKVELERPSQEAANTAASAAREQDRVKVSDRAATVRRLADRVAELPDVRQHRVEAVRERVESGTYKPSADDIADAILKDEK